MLSWCAGWAGSGSGTASWPLDCGVVATALRNERVDPLELRRSCVEPEGDGSEDMLCWYKQAADGESSIMFRECRHESLYMRKTHQGRALWALGHQEAGCSFRPAGVIVQVQVPEV